MTARPTLVSLNQMPYWFQERNNQWILNGYRPISGSVSACLYSWSFMHNETVNIFSHLIPATLFLLGELYIQQYLIAGVDLVVFSIFMLSATSCLLLSAIYHTFLNHSQHAEHLCLRLDMLGVTAFLLGDMVLETYTVFLCEPFIRNVYWSLIFVIGTSTVLITLHDGFQGPKHRGFRALMFVATGMCGAAPLIHGCYVFGLPYMMRKGFLHTLAKAGFLLSGTIIYVTRFPESSFPGRFDFFGSHSIFHILVVCAAVVQLTGYLKAYGIPPKDLEHWSLIWR